MAPPAVDDLQTLSLSSSRKQPVMRFGLGSASIIISFVIIIHRRPRPSFLELEKGGEDSLRFSTGQTATPSAQTNKFHTNNLTKILEHD